MQQRPPRSTPLRFWRRLRRIALIVGLVAGVAKLVATIHDWHHHERKRRHGVVPAQGSVTVELPATCPTPQPADG